MFVFYFSASVSAENLSLSRSSMSDKDSSTDAGQPQENPLADLSALNFGPAWARDQPKGKPRSRQGGSGDSQGGRSDQGGGDPRRNQQGGGRRQHSGGRDSRDSRDQRGFRGKGARDSRGRDGGDRRQDHRPQKTFTPAPEGISARIMPIEEGLDALAKDITATGRTHSVFDIAWLVLGGLERFHVIFESEDQMLYRSKKDHSIWLFQKECMAHFWSKGIVHRYYEEEIVEVDPPKGNFQSVARCGLSGELIGPPNHHAYQKTLLDLHREKFSGMALDRYKSRIVMEHGEEVLQEWLDSMTKHVRWRPKSEAPEETPKESTEEPQKLEKEDGSPTEKEEGAEEISEISPEPESGEKPESTPEKEPTVEVEEAVIILDNHLEVEQHFLTHGFEQEFETGKVLSVLANVPPKMIDPGLLTLLKTTVTDERRYPGKLASILCRQMSGRHLAVFKWKKHLHCGPARPRQVSDTMVMAERPSELFHWVIAHPGGKIDEMWKAVLPKDVDDETRHLWYHDLHWLINEGIVLLFSDGKLHAAKEIQKKKAVKKSAKTKKSKKSKKSESPEVVESEKPVVKEVVVKSSEEPVKGPTEEPSGESVEEPAEKPIEKPAENSEKED